MKEQIDRKDLIYKTNKYALSFQRFEATTHFGDIIFDGKT